MIETYVSIGKVIDYAIGVLKYFATAIEIHERNHFQSNKDGNT